MSRSSFAKIPMSRRKFIRSRFKSKTKKIFKNKYVKTGLLTAATTGTLFAVLPKATIEKAADTVQNLGETVYNFSENLGETSGTIVKAVGNTIDGLSNGLGSISENLNTFAFVSVFAFSGWVANKVFNRVYNKE